VVNNFTVNEDSWQTPSDLPDWETGPTSQGEGPRWQGMTMAPNVNPADPHQRRWPSPAEARAQGAQGAVRRAYERRGLEQEREQRTADPPSGALRRYAQVAYETPGMIGGAVARGADTAARQLSQDIRSGPSPSEVLRMTVEPNYYHDMVSRAVDARQQGNYPAWFTYMAAAPVGMAADVGSTLGLGRVGQIGRAGFNAIESGLSSALGRYGHAGAVAPTFAMPAGYMSGAIPGEPSR